MEQQNHLFKTSVDHFRVLQEGPAGGLNMPAGVPAGGPADGVRPCEIRRVPAGIPAGVPAGR